MKSWSVQDAKARFSEMLEACLRRGPQLVTKRGSAAAVLVPIQDWRPLTGEPAKTLKDFLLTDEARGNLNPPPRGRRARRPAQPFDR